MYESVHYIHGGRFMSRGTWQHGARTIDSYEYILVTEGQVFFSLGGEDMTLSPGDVLRIDPGMAHSGTRPSDGPVGFYWVHFTTDCPAELPPRRLHPESTAQAELLCRQLLHCANTEGYPRESTDCLVRLLIMELTFAARRGADTAHRLYAEVREWVRINADLPLRVSDVAAHFHYNADYLNRLFRRAGSGGLKAYIDHAKMERIRSELAQTSCSLEEVAQNCGFSDYKYFLKYFKYHEGISPTAYRELFCHTHLNNR